MKFTPQHEDFEKKIRKSFSDQKFMGFIKASLEKLEPGFCEIHVPFHENLTQQNGYFHAGIVSTLADNAAGYAAYSLMAKTSQVLTVELKINLLAPAEGEYLIAQSQVLKYGKTLTICRSEVFSVKKGQEKLCAAAQSTLIELRQEPGLHPN